MLNLSSIVHLHIGHFSKCVLHSSQHLACLQGRKTTVDSLGNKHTQQIAFWLCSSLSSSNSDEESFLEFSIERIGIYMNRVGYGIEVDNRTIFS